MSFDMNRFLADWEEMEKQTAKTTVKTAAGSFDMDRFLADWEQMEKQTGNKGQRVSAPSAVQTSEYALQSQSAETDLQQQNYGQMQQLFDSSKKSDEEELKRIKAEISAVSGYGAGADRSRLAQLFREKDAVEKRLKTGRYDEDLNVLERIQLTGQGIGESYDAMADVLVDTGVQAYKDWQKNKDNADYQSIKSDLADVTKQISAMQYKINNGFGNQVDISQYEKLVAQQKRLQGIVDEKYTTALDMEADSVQAMQRAMQAQQQATYGMDDTAAFLWNTGASIAENASLMPLAALPGGQNAILALMGAKTAAQKAVEVGESGGSAGEALVRGLSSGLIEAATEKLPLDNLVDMLSSKAGRSIIKNAVIQAGAEGTEEIVSYIANLMADIAAQDPDAQFSMKELLAAAAGGALSGGVMGAGATVIGNVRNQDAKTQQDVTDINVPSKAATGAINTEDTAAMQQNETDIDATNAPVVKKLKNSIPQLMEMETLKKVEGTEFEDDGTPLVGRIMNFFSKYGNKINRSGFGDVLISKSKINTSLRHGMGRAKISAFTAVPEVIANGKEIDITTNWKNRGYDTHIFAGPVEIAGQKSYLAVVVTKSPADNRYYLHEVVDQDGNFVQIKKDDSLQSSTTGLLPNGSTSESTLSSINNISQPIENINGNVLQQDGGGIKNSEVAEDINVPGKTAAVNPAETAVSRENEQLKEEFARIMGIDTRTEAEKVAEEQQSKVRIVQELADKGIAPQSDVIKAQADAQAKITEVNNRQINLDYQKIDTESGAVREKAIKNGYSKVVERIEKFAAKRQLKVKFFEGDQYVSGFEKDGTIYINVTDPKVMYKTAIHETLHGLRSNNQAEYESLKKAVFDAAGKNKKLFMTGVKAELGYINSASESVQASISNEDGTVNRDVVEEEVLAKMCEELIDDPQKFVDKLNGDRTAVQAIIDFVKELIDNIYIEFSNSEKAQMKKAVKEAEKALERYMKGETNGKFTIEDVNAEGEAVTVKDNETGAVRFNLWQYREGGGRQVLENTLKKQKYGDADVKRAVDLMYDMAKIMEDFARDYSTLMDWNNTEVVYDGNGKPVYSAMVKNGDYPINIDLSTICKKRIALQKVLNKLVKRNLIKDVSLSPENIATINKILKDNGYETQCPACFVESKRYNVEKWANDFANKWNEVLLEAGFVPQGKFDFSNGTKSDHFETMDVLNEDLSKADEMLSNIGQPKRDENGNILYKKNGKPRVYQANSKQRIVMLLKNNPQLRKMFTAQDLIGTEGIKNIKSQYPEIYSLILTNWGVATPKIVQTTVPYNNEVAVYKNIANKSKYIGGVRMFSFSDFTVDQVFDYVQVIADLYAQKAMMHTYTKEISFAKLFGTTGVKINLSYIPAIDENAGKDNAGLNANGELIYSEWGIQPEDAEALMADGRYSANLTPVMIGVSDNHIAKLLDTDSIRYIIPYHKSSLNPVVAKMTDIGWYKDYSDVQTTRHADGTALTKAENKKFDFYKTLEKTKDARKAADAYLKWCDKNGYIPKFEQFRDHKNYYKLLADYNLYDAVTGEYVPQKPVTMNFPEEFGEILGAELKKQADLNAELSAKDEQVFGEIVDAIKKDEVKFSIDPTFETEYDNWSKKYPNTDRSFIVGKTSDVLKSLGVKNNTIKWDTKKIRKIKKDHPEMTDGVIKQVPNLLEKPIIVMESKKFGSRLTIYGELYGTNNLPVLAVLELEPNNDDGSYDLDTIKLVNAYSKLPKNTKVDPNTEAQKLINSSKILYVEPNKNKTNAWLKANRLQLPSAAKFGLNAKISYSADYVKAEQAAKPSINTDNVQIPAEYEGKTLNEILDMLIEKHGAIEQGENPVREISVPKKSMDGKKVSKFARTVAEAEATPEDFAKNNLLEMAAKGELSHEVVTDKLALERAESILRNKGWDDALAEWNALNKTDKAPNKYDIALGQMLYNEAVNNGNTKLAQKLVCDLCVQATRAGQTVQAFRLLKKLTPEGKLYMLQKSLDQINREQLERYKSDYEDIEIPTELADKLLKAKDAQTADAAVEEIEQYIADRIPSTVADKFNAWRYLAMLGNPRTHIRNVFGNLMFSPFKLGKDIIGEQLEKVIKDGVKTKAKVSKKSNPDLWAYAEKDFAQNESAVKGEAKYDGKSGIKEKQRVFDNKYLEKARKFNADWLEKEDIVFLKNHYVRALAGAMKANGITAKTANSLENQEIMAAIKTYATNEAQKATYRDVNAFSKAVQNLKKTLNKNSASSVFIEGILPFARTPANIIARGVEYSPVGAVRGAVNLATGGIDTTSVETTIASIKQVLKGVKSGKYTTAEALDQLSAGLTGTMIGVLGFILAAMGIAKGKEDDGGKEGDLEKLYGIQDYSLMIGGTSYTIDWAAPAAMPFFVGVELYNAFSDTEESTGIVSALLKITDPVFEMSMLDGINNAIEATAYTDTHPIIAMGTSSVLNYVGQAVPTLAGQVARTGNRYRTQTYIDKNKKTSATVQRFMQQQQAKIPVLNNMLTPYYDQWGRKQDNGNILARAFQNFASPGYLSTDKSTEVDDEIMRIYKETKDTGVLPDYADKKFSLNGEYKYLTSEEYETFAQVKGQTSYKIIEELLNNPYYKVLDSDEQAEAIAKAYSYAQAKAKEEVSDYELSKQEKLIDENPVYGVMGTTAFKTEADTDKNGSIKTEEAVAYLDSKSFTLTQKALLFSCMCPNVKNNPYK